MTATQQLPGSECDSVDLASFASATGHDSVAARSATVAMNDITTITDTWGNWIASTKLETGCKFTASTNYSPISYLDGYHQYQCVVNLLDIAYDGNSPPTGRATASYELWYDNGTTLPQSQTFSYSAASEQSFAWSITEALSVGVDVSTTEGAPEVASSTQNVSVNLSFSSTQGATTSNAQNWNVNTQVVVPPNASVRCDAAINEQTYDIDFTDTVQISGHVAIWLDDKRDFYGGDNPHYLWFIPITDVFSDVINNKLIDISGYTLNSDGVQATARGTFSGSQGIRVDVTTTQYPLRSSVAAQDFRPIRKARVHMNAVPAPAADQVSAE